MTSTETKTYNRWLLQNEDTETILDIALDRIGEGVYIQTIQGHIRTVQYVLMRGTYHAEDNGNESTLTSTETVREVFIVRGTTGSRLTAVLENAARDYAAFEIGQAVAFGGYMLEKRF